VALELRPNCEYCDEAPPPDALDARICCYECTFCTTCVETILHNVCPNCGGGFTPRPIRPVTERRVGLCFAKRPASSRRVHLSYPEEEVARFAAVMRDIPPERR
jgi:hypothetical protein